jgi:hypothetical protein
MTKYTSSKTSAQPTPDREWFAKNPHRSHRLREMFNNEYSSERLDPIRKVTPDRHKLMVLVRQLQPGVRLRIIYCRNIDCPIPDEEAILEEVWSRALKYVRGGRA